MILSVGEILYDIFPEYKRLGGAPFNFSFHLKKLGLPVRFISRVGDDPDGRSILARLEQNGFSPECIQVDPIHRTGEVVVDLDDQGEPSFRIVPDVAYDYIAYDTIQETLQRERVDLIYFGTLVQRSEYGFATIQKMLLSRDPAAKCLYDINLRPGCYDKAIIKASLQHADLLKINESELEILKQMTDARGQGDAVFIRSLIQSHGLEMVALTRGANGSDLFTPENHYAVGAPPVTGVRNPVGAGDAYAAVLAIGFLQGWEPKRMLRQATQLAADVCQVDGAVPEDPAFYRDWEWIRREGADAKE